MGTVYRAYGTGQLRPRLHPVAQIVGAGFGTIPANWTNITMEMVTFGCTQQAEDAKKSDWHPDLSSTNLLRYLNQVPVQNRWWTQPPPAPPQQAGNEPPDDDGEYTCVQWCLT
jgi:hypothetical protein